MAIGADASTATGVAAGAHAPNKKVVSATSERIAVGFLEFIFSPDSLMWIYLCILSKMCGKPVKELRRKYVD
jgi:hypothetical protein